MSIKAARPKPARPKANPPEVSAMIRELVRMFEKELGTALPTDSAHRLEAALCRQYGGERLYVPKLPKLVHQVQMVALGTGMGTLKLAGQMGISVRQLRRVARGR